MEDHNSDVRWIFVYAICLVGLLVNSVVLLGVFLCIGFLLGLNSLF